MPFRRTKEFYRRVSDRYKNNVVWLVIKGYLQGFAQVFFQESPWTGIAFLFGIFWSAYANDRPSVAWGIVVSVAFASIAGLIVREPIEEGIAGLWGFNGALVGAAFTTFFGDDPRMWFAMCFCAMFSTWVRTGLNNIMKPWKINSLTFPFVLTTWFFMLAARYLTGIGLEDSTLANPAFAPAALDATYSYADFSNFGDFVIAWLKGVSQVYFCDDWVTGIAFLVGLLICTPWACFWAAFAALTTLLFGWWYGMSTYDLTQGLYGYSAVLTGIAVGTVFYKMNFRVFLWTFVAVVATLVVQAALDNLVAPYGMAALTGPFCFATWLFLLPQYKLDSQVHLDFSFWHRKARERAAAEHAAVATTTAS
ncbi:MAG: urea transporter [Burkholderiales bacterium]|nr:urea transporter [Burkholderiales bacterium]